MGVLGKYRQTVGDRSRHEYRATWLRPGEALTGVSYTVDQGTATVESTGFSTTSFWFFLNGGDLGDEFNVIVRQETSFGQVRYDHLSVFVETNGGATIIGGNTGLLLSLVGPPGPTGLTGPTGPGGGGTGAGGTGPTGPAGQSSTLWIYDSDTVTTSGDPGTGDLCWTNSTQINATQINISHITTDGIDIEAFWPLLGIGTKILVQDENASVNFQIWQVNAATTPHANAYLEIPVTLLSSGGTGNTNFPNNHHLLFSFNIPGNTGPTGPTGPGGGGGGASLALILTAGQYP